MAKKAYVGVDGVARKVKKIYCGVENFTKRELPIGYTQVEYIESSGTQYIDTGFSPNQDTAMEIVFQTSQSSEGGIAVTDSSWKSNGFGIWVNAAGYGNEAYDTFVFNGTDKITAKLDKNNLYKDGVLIWTATESTFQTGQSLTLGALNRAGSMSEYLTGKIYACKIWDDGALVRDYVPCKNTDDVAGLYDIVNGSFYQSAGSGAFSSGAECGSFARKVKKAYVGVGGVARMWFGSGLEYYGTAESLKDGRDFLAATTVGNYALFAGGSRSSAMVDAYDTSLTKSVPTSLIKGVYYLAATTVGNYALFAGGFTLSDKVNAYNTSLTRSTPSSLSSARYNLAASTVGNYALFAGGRNGSTSSDKFATVDVYNSSLTKSMAPNLNYTLSGMAGGAVGNYALFVGHDNTGVSTTYRAQAYDYSLTKIDLTDLRQARTRAGSTTIGDYALFGGGTQNVPSSDVEAYSTSLTKTILESLSIARDGIAATTVGDYALFGGGSGSANKFQSTKYSNVDVYDKDLIRTTAKDMSVSRGYLAATTVGNYALFAGGFLTPGFSDVVDVYTAY